MPTTAAPGFSSSLLSGGGSEKKRIYVTFEGTTACVAWFSGASDESICKGIAQALRLPAGAGFCVIDPSDDEGSVLAISDSMPSGLQVTLQLGRETKPPASAVEREARGGEEEGGGGVGGASTHQQQSPYQPSLPLSGSGHNSDSEEADRHEGEGRPTAATSYGGVAVSGGLNGGGGSGKKQGDHNNKGEGEEGDFRGQLLKFERINAHLANERTWLAWVRTALSVLTLALSFLSLTEDLNTWTKVCGGILGIAFVSSTLLTYVTGWKRYQRVTEVLAWRGKQIQGKFGRFSLSYQAQVLAFSLALALPLYGYAAYRVDSL